MFYRKEPEVQQKELEREPTEFETQYGSEPTCFEVHETWRLECDQKECRNWMNYGEDLNCAVVCARKYDNGMSLREVAERMGVSFRELVKLSMRRLRN